MPTPKNIRDFAREYRQAVIPNGHHKPSRGSQFHLDNLAAFIATSPQIHDGLIVEKLVRVLAGTTKRQILLIRLLPSDAGEPAKDWSPLNSLPFDRFAFADRLQQIGDGVRRLFVRVNGHPGERKYLSAVLGHCARFFGHVIVHVSPTAGRGPVTECIRRSKYAYALVQQCEESFGNYRRYNSWLTKRGKARRTYLKPILCLGDDELPRTEEDIYQSIGSPAHHLLRDCPSERHSVRLNLGCEWPGGFCFDLRRLAREISGCRIGLALSSGGAKGFAYVGVIQALEENGIEVDMIAGCSMGAYIGALWAAGHDSRFIRHKAFENNGRWGKWKLIDPVYPPRRGFIGGDKIKRLLGKSIGKAHFCDLLRPLRVVATNLATLERKVFNSGEVAMAVHASSAIPGVCVPVEIDGEHYVDGGIIDPLPVDILREEGIEKVIAVNTVPTPQLMRQTRERALRLEAKLRNRPWWRRIFNQQFNYFADGNILDIIQQCFTGAQIPNAEEACRNADVVIRPINVEGSWHDFNRPRKYIALGRRVTTGLLPELKALSKPMENRHEYQTIDHPMATAA
jgi:NTE family protein